MNSVELLAYKVNKGYVTSSEFQDIWNSLEELEKEKFLNAMKQHRKSILWRMFLIFLFNINVRFVFL